jgi:hypothetical protein
MNHAGVANTDMLIILNDKLVLIDGICFLPIVKAVICYTAFCSLLLSGN